MALLTSKSRHLGLGIWVRGLVQAGARRDASSAGLEFLAHLGRHKCYYGCG